MKKLYIAITFLLLTVCGAKAQMLALNVEAPPELTVTVMTDGVLDYGNVIIGQQYSISLSDAGAETISIEGKKNKSVQVTIMAPDLMLNTNNTIPFTLGAAYNNSGQDNKSQATVINGNSVTFELSGEGSKNDNSNDRGNSNADGGPGKGKQSTETAYLYLYGDIDVGSVRAGTYTNTITVSVSYTN